LEFVEILIFITVDIFKHTAKKNKKIKPADQILPEVYGTTLNGWRSDNTMAKKKNQKTPTTMIYKTLHRKLKIEQHEPH
jgi:hypothetical protein